MIKNYQMKRNYNFINLINKIIKIPITMFQIYKMIILVFYFFPANFKEP